MKQITILIMLVLGTNLFSQEIKVYNEQSILFLPNNTESQLNGLGLNINAHTGDNSFILLDYSYTFDNTYDLHKNAIDLGFGVSIKKEIETRAKVYSSFADFYNEFSMGFGLGVEFINDRFTFGLDYKRLSVGGSYGVNQVGVSIGMIIKKPRQN